MAKLLIHTVTSFCLLQCVPKSSSRKASTPSSARDGHFDDNDGHALGTYEQCGGKSGPRCQYAGFCQDEPWGASLHCLAADECVRYSENYWQCRPAQGGADSVEKIKLKMYEQCGGKGSQLCTDGKAVCGDKAYDEVMCPADAQCKRDNDWYWQVGRWAGMPTHCYIWMHTVRPRVLPAFSTYSSMHFATSA
jgi:hypothetical protein